MHLTLSVPHDVIGTVFQDEEDRLSHRRSWEEDYVLKQAFSALVPAFDPRPGRTNVPQIQDFEIPPPGKCTRMERERPRWHVIGYTATACVLVCCC